jgi:hypothetical protein
LAESTRSGSRRSLESESSRVPVYLLGSARCGPMPGDSVEWPKFGRVESRECSWADGDRVECEFDNLNVKLLGAALALMSSCSESD